MPYRLDRGLSLSPNSLFQLPLSDSTTQFQTIPQALKFPNNNPCNPSQSLNQKTASQGIAPLKIKMKIISELICNRFQPQAFYLHRSGRPVNLNFNFTLNTQEIIRSVNLSNQRRVRDLRLTPAQVLELIGAGYCVAPAGRDGCTVYAPNWKGEREIVMPKKQAVYHDYEGAILARQYLPN